MSTDTLGQAVLCVLDEQDASPTGESHFSFQSLSLVTRARMAATNKAHWTRFKDTLTPGEALVINTINASSLSLFQIGHELRHKVEDPKQYVIDAIARSFGPHIRFDGLQPDETLLAILNRENDSKVTMGLVCEYYYGLRVYSDVREKLRQRSSEVNAAHGFGLTDWITGQTFENDSAHFRNEPSPDAQPSNVLEFAKWLARIFGRVAIVDGDTWTFSTYMPLHRRITVNHDEDGQKICPLDDNVLTGFDTIKAHPGVGETVSIHLKLCNTRERNGLATADGEISLRRYGLAGISATLICIDFDTKELEECELYQMLTDQDCLRTETDKGFHVYVLLETSTPPAIKRCVRVLRDTRFPVDLLTGDHVNVWEPADRAMTGQLVPMHWEDLEPFFDVEIVSKEAVETMTRARDAYRIACEAVGVPSMLEGSIYSHGELNIY